MNELLIIEMMGELNPELLEDNYIEKDMKRGIKSFFKYIFPFKVTKPYEFPMDHSLTKEVFHTNIDLNTDLNQEDDVELADGIQMNDDNVLDDNEINNRGFSISIFERKFRNLIKIASGIAATSLVVIGIIVILIRRNKSGMKTFKKKVQIIY